jgi:hypothetical protein
MRRWWAVLLVAGMVFGFAQPVGAAVSYRDGPGWVSGADPFGDCPGRALDARLPAGAVEPYVAANPADPADVVAAWTQNRFRGVIVGASSDGGRTWRRVVVQGLTRCTGGGFDYVDNVWLSFGPRGLLYLSAHVFADSGASARVGMRSADGGRSWSLPVPIVTENRPRAGSFSGGAIAADPYRPGVVYSVVPKFYQPATDNRPYRGLVLISRSRDAGRRWERPVLAYDSGDDALTTGHQLLVLPDRTLVDIFTLVQHPGTARQTKRIGVLRFTDGGQHWSAPTFVEGLGSAGTVDPDRPAPVNTGSSLVSSVAIDRTTGRMYLVWQDARFTAGAADAIALSASDDAGRTWSPAEKVNATPTTVPIGNQQAFAPTVDVAADGTVAVGYYDLRFNDPGATLPTDRWLVRCRPDRTGFRTMRSCTETRLTPHSFDTRQATDIDVGPPGFFLGSTQGLTHTARDFVAVFAQSGLPGTDTDQPPRITAQRVPVA